MSEEISVVAELLGNTGSGDAIATALQQCALPSRQEPGCLSYVVHRDTAEVDRVVMIERWKSQAALADHEKTPHFGVLLMALKPLLAEPLKVSVLKALP